MGLSSQQLAFAKEDKIINFINYSKYFSSAGQPTKQQLQQIKEQGYERVIYIAFTGNHTALKDEDEIVNSLKMSYLHIPVDFNDPRVEDFEAFNTAMKANPEMKTLLHCQVNYRASTFSFLYRVISKSVPMSQAKQDLDKVWEPNKVWFNFIKTVLGQYKINTECDGCDWGGNEF
jgi:protein tyrosine phosphatase (PTP) superfamily phosphohydrolase (DUF442 family)